MIRTILSLLFCILLFCKAIAQPVNFNIPISEDDIKGRNITGYYDAGNNRIIIDTQKKDSITHLFYDSAFNLQNEYKVLGQDRRLLSAQFGSGRKKPFFLKNISIQNIILEVFASKDSVCIYKLDPQTESDVKIAGIDLNKTYRDEELTAIMPNENGCNFLTVSLKKKIVLLYKWKFGDSDMTVKELELPSSTLSKEVIKERGTYLEIKFKDMFSNLSVSHTCHPDIFQFPSLSQLFYNDSCLYILNKTASETGINVFKINTNNGTIVSSNYFVNKPMSDVAPRNVAFPVATIYDSLLIIQNASQKNFEYYFYHLYTGSLIVKHETKSDNTLYRLVHSPLRQLGTFGSGKEEKELDNEKLFMRRRGHGTLFIKPYLNRDSLVFTFGSFVPTKGAEGWLLGMASIGAGVGTGMMLGENHFLVYMAGDRNKFLYAHSKFSLKDIQPSAANNIRTYLDDFIRDKKMEELRDDNSVLIALPERIYIGIYQRRDRLFELSEYQQ
jgi:hypothetical protein